MLQWRWPSEDCSVNGQGKTAAATAVRELQRRRPSEGCSGDGRGRAASVAGCSILMRAGGCTGTVCSTRSPVRAGCRAVVTSIDSPELQAEMWFNNSSGPGIPVYSVVPELRAEERIDTKYINVQSIKSNLSSMWLTIAIVNHVDEREHLPDWKGTVI